MAIIGMPRLRMKQKTDSDVILAWHDIQLYPQKVWFPATETDTNIVTMGQGCLY